MVGQDLMPAALSRTQFLGNSHTQGTHHSPRGLGENTHLANRNLLTSHCLFLCSDQPTLILTAKLGVRPLGCSLGE